MYNDHNPSFPAVLKTMDDKILEYGNASASVEKQSVDFTSQFVPICKMGTVLKIVHVQKDIEIQSFVGEVYLSSQRLLRLVSITDEVLPGAALVGAYPVSLTGSVSGTFQPQESERHFAFASRRLTASTRTFTVSIHNVSLSQIRFISDQKLPKGQHIELTVDQPVRLKSLPLEVENFIIGSRDSASYHCNILELSGENRIALESFVRELSVHIKKMFPPVPTASDAEGL